MTSINFNIDYRTNLLEKPVYLDDALDVLDENVDYHGVDTSGLVKKPKDVPEEYKYVYAIDFKMLWVSRKEQFGRSNDFRTPLKITQEDLDQYLAYISSTDYLNDLGKPIDMRIMFAKNYLEVYYTMNGDKRINDDINKTDGNYDLEKININLETHKIVQELGRVIVVNSSGKVLYDQFNIPETSIVWVPLQNGLGYGYTTRFAGKLKKNKDIRNDILALIGNYRKMNRNTKIIGHNLNSLEPIGLDGPSYGYIHGIIRDTALFFEYNQMERNRSYIFPFNLEILGKGFLNKDIESSANESIHARTSLALYKLFREGIEYNFTHKSNYNYKYRDLFYINTDDTSPLVKEHDIIKKTKGEYLREIFIREIIKNLIKPKIYDTYYCLVELCKHLLI